MSVLKLKIKVIFNKLFTSHLILINLGYRKAGHGKMNVGFPIHVKVILWYSSLPDRKNLSFYFYFFVKKSRQTGRSYVKLKD